MDKREGNARTRSFRFGWTARLLTAVALGAMHGSQAPGAQTPSGITPQLGTPVYRLEGLNFSPYIDGQDPNRGSVVSEQQLRTRLAIVAPYTKWIRTFGATHGLEATPRVAPELGLRVAMGAWIDGNRSSNEQQLANLIAAARAGYVDMAIVGQRSFVQAGAQREGIDRVRAPRSAGGPCGRACEHSRALRRVAVPAGAP